MKKEIDKRIVFESPASGLGLLNLTEFLMAKSPDFSNEINFWFKLSLKCYEKLNPANSDRALIILSHLLSTLN